ncbi:MAG TPA: cytochrome c1 [Steroidobacteraceae bacterium]|nr:cytochrome c1 [Steroidobacteraceae bacterium]
MRTDRLAPALAALALLALPIVSPAGEGESYPSAGNDIRNHASLQRGARNFMNYCSGCHSAKYVRYNRIAKDLGIPEAVLKTNLMFTSEKTYETIKIAMTPDDAKRWFGTVPPDLSLIARARGTDYLYAFLHSFYADPSKPTGVNNTVLPGTAMPHVLAELQGVQTATFTTEKHDDGTVETKLEKFELTQKGTLSPEKYDEFVRDTVNFLQYIGEPIEAQRRDLGVWVMLFLLVFTAFAYLLYKEYWRDVH